MVALSPGPTSELWGEEQGLQQGVEVAGAPLVFDAAQIASSSGWRWLISPFRPSPPGGGGGGKRSETFLLLFLEKIPKHCCVEFVHSVLLSGSPGSELVC